MIIDWLNSVNHLFVHFYFEKVYGIVVVIEQNDLKVVYQSKKVVYHPSGMTIE